MRGVPARRCDAPPARPAHLARDDRPGQFAERMTHGALRRGARCGGVRGIGGGQRPATVRYRARGSGPGCPATCGESPHHPPPLQRGILGSFTLSVLVARILRVPAWASRLGVPEVRP
jgi:hypothetical protein